MLLRCAVGAQGLQLHTAHTAHSVQGGLNGVEGMHAAHGMSAGLNGVREGKSESHTREAGVRESSVDVKKQGSTAQVLAVVLHACEGGMPLKQALGCVLFPQSSGGEKQAVHAQEQEMERGGLSEQQAVHSAEREDLGERHDSITATMSSLADQGAYELLSLLPSAPVEEAACKASVQQLLATALTQLASGSQGVLHAFDLQQKQVQQTLQQTQQQMQHKQQQQQQTQQRAVLAEEEGVAQLHAKVCVSVKGLGLFAVKRLKDIDEKQDLIRL